MKNNYKIIMLRVLSPIFAILMAALISSLVIMVIHQDPFKSICYHVQLQL
ncbi:hypothetical protein [Biomaibacter acetigenes]|nr:hypothetical protein [Biomaibacter acetigenes]